MSLAHSSAYAHSAHTYPAGSDLMGRTTAFNATLFLTSVFGVFAALAGTFPLLCFALFLLGSAVGVRCRTPPSCLLQ